MKTDSLIELGFTKNQAKLYLLLFKNPGISAGKIAKELSIDRSFTYNIIESLIKKGLVYYSIKNNNKIFFSEKPDKILEELEYQKNKTKKFINELKQIEVNKSKAPLIEVYEGKSALKKYLSEIIQGKSFLTIGGGGKLNIFEILKYEYPHYFKELKKANIGGKIICSDENKSFWKKNVEDTNISIKSIKGAGKENSITILKDKLILSEESESPNIVIVNNINHAHSMNHYFQYLWRIAKK
ncbi:MAG: MarR family transcriptional regulator [Nanoarchaeota archaeon]|nr:MarR family transcriptional regulator [Nanoarchaeota archaeon]